MGLFSDILEECRDRAIDYDPCLFPTGFLFYPSSKQREFRQTISEYRAEINRDDSKQIRRKLREQATLLENLKHNYLISEKILIDLQKSCQFRSELTKGKLQQVENDLRRSYRTVCGIIQEIHDEIGAFEVQISLIQEDAISAELFELILCSFIYSIKNVQNAPFDTSAFRKVVSDMASIIRYFQKGVPDGADKNIVSDYLKKNFNISQAHICCQNCGKTLLKEIPYCLNCYERN